MLFEPEDTAVVKANALKNSIAIKQTMVENGYLCAGFRIEFSVDVNLRFLDAGCRARPTFNYRLDNCISSRFVGFRFVYYRRISGLHNREKNLGGSLRNSRGKVKALNS